MENNFLEGTKGQSITYPSGEALGRDIHMRHSKCNRKPPQRFDPVFQVIREWKSDDAASLFYILQHGDCGSNIDTYNILSLLAD